ncbi:cytochrome P450 [Pseudonocardia endophytica]|uniref:Cytochrome P450 n=1 Tax=Pseudonocardia endophytica TaxID=401976 RepID=A0A4R1HMF2_PSEEN|nr:cytochrome P450 [Pseudonocardia endophytica]TCK22213.1 cytochrome P450 [Pseudonocardia endophytica]
MTRSEFPFTRTCPFAPPAEYGELRDAPRPQRVPLRTGGQAWLLTRHDQVREALKDGRLSNDRGAPGFPSPIPIPDEFKVGGSLLGMDPPEHGPARRLVAGEFTHKRVQAMRPTVERNVARAITDMLDGPDPADLHQALGVRITMDTITELLGLEDLDRGFMHARTKVMFGGQSTAEERRRAVTELNGHFVDIAKAKAAHPADDVISRLVARWPDPKDWDEIGNMVRLLLNGGHDSTASMISLGTLTFLQHPDQLKLLVDDPSLAVSAVEEMLRFLGVTDLTTARVATEDMEIDGATIRAGEGVYPTTASANRDTAAFDRPDELDITRGTRNHLAFGNGRHLCLGMDLARLELQVTYTELFRRVPELQLAVPFEDLRYRQGGLVFGVESLPVTW